MAKQYDLMVRLLLVGDSGVGKTCLLCKYVDHAYQASYAATIGIDFKVKNLIMYDQRVRIQIWDTAGQERFETITKQYYRRAQGVLVVYDITNEASFRHIPKWLSQIKQYGPENIEVTIVGNKTDLSEFRQVAQSDVKQYAESNQFSYFETNAVGDDNVGEIYEDLVDRIMRNQQGELSKQRLDCSVESDSEIEFTSSLYLQNQNDKKCCP